MNQPDIEVLKIMILKSIDKLNIAKDLFNLVHYDDAVSRAYYSIFHALSAVLLSEGLHFSSHRKVIGNFNKEFIKTKLFPADFHRKIEKLFNDRQIGDYELDSPLDREKAEDNLKNAGEIITKCKEYLSNKYNMKM